MATITTTTQTDILAYPSLPSFAVNFYYGKFDGVLFSLVRTGTDTLGVYRSTDNGVSWSLLSSFTHSTLQEWSRLVVDAIGYAHVAYRITSGSNDVLYYRRLNIGSGSWSSALQVSGTDANGGTPGYRWQGIDIAVYTHPDNAYAIAVAAHYQEGGTKYGLAMIGVSINRTGTVYLNNGLITNNRFWLQSGTTPGRSGVTIEVEHNGNGFYANVPHLRVSYGRTQLRMVKLAWNGTGWNGPSNWQTIRNPIPAQDYHPARWDGVQWVMGVVSPDDATAVRIYQRNQANTLTTTLDTPAHPTGNIRHIGLSYDAFTRDLRVFAVGTSTAVLYYVDYTRATSTWTAWAIAVATAIGPGAGEWSVRAGGSTGNARIDIITTASGSPNTVTHTAMSASSVPNNAVWAAPAAGSDLFNGAARDVNAGLLLDWEFSDPDAFQVQGSYALSRQIGVGTIQYWRASDSTWQATEQQNSTATTSVTLPSSWGAGTDAVHSYRVRVWDSANVGAAGYSPVWQVVPSVLANPTISSPTNAQVLNLDRMSVTWSVSEQTAYRIILNTNPAGSQVLYDSGWVTDSTTTTFDVPVTLTNGGSYTVTVQTRNLEGLASTAVNRNFSVQYTAPPPSISAFAPSTTNGYITVTPSANAPAGLQPTISSMDLYRRPVLSSTLNANPTFAGNTTGFAVGGGSGGTVTYSTAQFSPGSSPGSARLVPNGSGATPSVESSHVAVDVTQAIEGTGWVRADTANKPVVIQVNWYTTGGAYLSSTLVSVTTPPVAGWMFMRVIADGSGIATAARASVSIGLSNTPAAGDAIYVDELRMRYADTTTGVRVAQGVGAAVAVNDWGAASGVSYEYQWVVTGSNGTSIAGPWLS
jgi:hypothetical protein